MTKKAKNKVPELRFPEFHGDWETGRVDHFLVRYVNPVKVEPETIYKEIGIRSHGKGIFHKDPVTGEALGNKRVYWVHPEAFTVNIVFAWEQAVALTSSDEKGYIASHRFLMFLPRENRADLKFILLFFLRKRGKHLLELASPGGAGRNKTLGQDSFAELEITLPKKEEQEKIASFLQAVDTRLNQLRRKRELLQTYKCGVMQKLFSQQIRFKQDDGSVFPDWQEASLGEVAKFAKGKGLSKEDLVESGNLKCIRYAELYTLYDEVIDKVFSSTNIDSSDLILSIENDVIIPASGESAIEIAKAACVTISGVALGGDLNIIRSYINGEFLAYYLNHYRKKDIARVAQGNTVVHLYSSQLAQIKIEIPFQEEQKKIVKFLTMIDKKIKAVSQQIRHTEQFKKGLFQKIFV